MYWTWRVLLVIWAQLFKGRLALKRGSILRVRVRVYSLLFSRKIVEIKNFALRGAILHKCQNYLGGRDCHPA